jgi:hypothetical protein
MSQYCQLEYVNRERPNVKENFPAVIKLMTPPLNELPEDVSMVSIVQIVCATIYNTTAALLCSEKQNTSHLVFSPDTLCIMHIHRGIVTSLTVYIINSLIKSIYEGNYFDGGIF